jgi:arylsulfatase A-like enzyme
MPQERTLALALLALAVGATPAAAATPALRRPNIVLVIADDWGWGHASGLGDKVVRTPNIDRVLREGLLFANAFAAAPSCTPSRAAILTGRYPHQLEEGGSLWGTLPSRYAVYPDLLEASGYVVGLKGKGWGPGDVGASGRSRNPAGPKYDSLAAFLKGVPAEKPFAFWYGSGNPHRPYPAGAGPRLAAAAARVAVSPAWVDTAETRADVLDYYQEVEAFDAELGSVLADLQASGHLADTLLVVTSDNGMPFPRAKANVYDAGTHLPLIVRWPGRVRAGSRSTAFVNLLELGPTFLDAAGLPVPKEMAGRSLLPLLRGARQPGREHVFIERERHANVRKGDLSYPVRAVRTGRYLYVRNLRPDRWPGGDPQMHFSVGTYGDCDDGPTKQVVLGHEGDAEHGAAFARSFAKRPAEELYDVVKDPHQIVDLAGRPALAAVKAKLGAQVDAWMKATSDPRVDPKDDRWDAFAYYGNPGPGLAGKVGASPTGAGKPAANPAGVGSAK